MNYLTAVRESSANTEDTILRTNIDASRVDKIAPSRISIATDSNSATVDVNNIRWRPRYIATGTGLGFPVAYEGRKRRRM